MPYMLKKDGDQVCVCKQNADGSAGDSLQCYTGADAKDKAEKYMKALYANTPMNEKMQMAWNDMWTAIKKALHLADGESLDQKIMAVRDSFYQTFDRMLEPAPGCYVKEVYDGYVIAEEGEKLYRVKYTIDTEGKVTFEARDQWQPVQMQYVNMQQAFSFTELSADEFLKQPIGLKYIDGMAAGTFISMSGEEVTFDPEELQAYVDNTVKIIESTRTESGELVGLPIDKQKHDHLGGAGWIVGLELDKARNVIRFLVNWTEEGITLIKNNLSRFFSPSTNLENKTILGGSLTNWPATRNDQGQILLRPIELSQSIKELDMDKTLFELLAELPGKVAEAVKGAKPTPAQEPEPSADLEDSPTLQNFLQTPDGVEELGKRATEIAQDAIKAEKRKMHAVEFAASIVGGTKAKPFGLKGVKPSEIVALLLSLPEPQARAVEKMLSKALDAAVDFAEHGFDSEGFIQKPQLPESIKPYARQWVEAGKPISGFFAANPELGGADQYNLVEFVKKED